MPSSVVRAMRFDPMRSVLEIVFRGARGAYRYFDVPADEWRRFREAPSKGEYLNSFFKARQYPFEKIAEPISLMPQKAKPQREDESLQWGEPVAFPAVRGRDERVDPAMKIRARSAPVQVAMNFRDFEDAA